jgi:hypothetical protein
MLVEDLEVNLVILLEDQEELRCFLCYHLLMTQIHQELGTRRHHLLENFEAFFQIIKIVEVKHVLKEVLKIVEAVVQGITVGAIIRH